MQDEPDASLILLCPMRQKGSRNSVYPHLSKPRASRPFPFLISAYAPSKPHHSFQPPIDSHLLPLYIFLNKPTPTMPLSLSDLNADTPPFLTTPFHKSSLSHFLASGRILALFLRDLALGPSAPEDTINALFAEGNYAADFKVRICGSTFPAVNNWLTFLPSAEACVEVPWVFTVLGVLVWVVGVLCLFGLVSSSVWLLVRMIWLVVGFLLDCVVELAGWAVGVLGRWLGMGEEGPREVPVVVVVDTERKQ